MSEARSCWTTKAWLWPERLGKLQLWTAAPGRRSADLGMSSAFELDARRLAALAAPQFVRSPEALKAGAQVGMQLKAFASDPASRLATRSLLGARFATPGRADLRLEMRGCSCTDGSDLA